MKQSVLMKIVVGREIEQLLPSLSWLEREAVNLKVGSSSLPGSVLTVTAPGEPERRAARRPSALLVAKSPLWGLNP